MEAINFYLNEAAMENRDGALNLAKGNIAHAMEILQNAIHILDQLLLLPDLSFLDIDGPNRCTSIEVPFLNNDRLFSYNRTLVFAHPTSLTCSIHEVSLYRGIVLFNMALAYQMKGAALNQNNSLTRSLHFYHASLMASCVLPTGRNPDYDLLRVAALNNQAMVMTSMLDYDGAKMVLDEVRANWRHTLVLHYTTEAFGQEDIEGFLLNTMESIPPTAASCA